MPSAAFTKAADDSRKLKAKPSNEELLEVSQPLPYGTMHL
jgi:acyl-CoA-binding protein